MTRQDDPLLIWEQDGDLERMKAFFGGLSHSEDKERIKEMVLARLAQDGVKEAVFEGISMSNPLHEPGKARQEVDETGPILQEPDVPGQLVSEPKHSLKEPGRAARLRNLPRNLKTKGQNIWRRWGWKLAFPAAALVLVVFIGQAGLFGEFGRVSFSKAKSGSMLADQPMEASSPDNAVKSEMQRQDSQPSTAAGMAGAGQPQRSSDGQNMTKEFALAQKDSTSFATAIVPPVPGPVVPPADADLPRKIIQNLNATLQVEDIESTLQKLSAMAQTMGGYVVDSQMDNQQNAGNSTAHITFKVPAAKFDSARSSLSETGKILTQHLSANDITNQYYDADTRLKHWQAEEKRYTDILNQAKTIEDILRVEEALSNIRMQIEQLQGQLKLWNHEVAFSTIQVQLQTKPNPVKVDEPWQPVAWSKTWEAAQNAVLKTISSIWNTLNYLIVGLGYALPFVILGGAGYLGYRQWRKSRSK